jgi:rubrerythrin
MSYKFNAGEVFKIAIAIEENGKKFYEKSLNVIEDPSVKKLFEELGSQEVEHKKKFEELRNQLPSDVKASTVWDPENELEQYIQIMANQHVFVSNASMDALLAQVKDVRSALKLAIDFEKDSVIFFLTLEEASEGKKDQELIRTLVKEEQEHLRRLSMELKRIGR